MFGILSLFGRSAALIALDDALRASGVHPALVPEAVKITVVRLHKRGAAGGRTPALRDVAALLAYCGLGREDFAERNGADAADRAERRLEAAIAAGDSFDAKLILLALHADVVAPEIAERIEVEDR